LQSRKILGKKRSTQNKLLYKWYFHYPTTNMSWFRVRKACRSSSFINLSFLRFKQKMLIELIPANMIRYVIFYADNKNYHSETINIFAVYLISLATLLKFSGIILVSIDKSDFLLILVPQICLCIYRKHLSASVRKENFQTKNRRRKTHLTIFKKVRHFYTSNLFQTTSSSPS